MVAAKSRLRTKVTATLAAARSSVIAMSRCSMRGAISATTAATCWRRSGFARLSTNTRTGRSYLRMRSARPATASSAPKAILKKPSMICSSVKVFCSAARSRAMRGCSARVRSTDKASTSDASATDVRARRAQRYAARARMGGASARRGEPGGAALQGADAVGEAAARFLAARRRRAIHRAGRRAGFRKNGLDARTGAFEHRGEPHHLRRHVVDPFAQQRVLDALGGPRRFGIALHRGDLALELRALLARPVELRLGRCFLRGERVGCRAVAAIDARQLLTQVGLDAARRLEVEPQLIALGPAVAQPAGLFGQSRFKFGHAPAENLGLGCLHGQLVLELPDPFAQFLHLPAL